MLQRGLAEQQVIEWDPRMQQLKDDGFDIVVASQHQNANRLKRARAIAEHVGIHDSLPLQIMNASMRHLSDPNDKMKAHIARAMLNGMSGKPMKDYCKRKFQEVHGRSPKGGELKRLRISMYGMDMLDMVNLANVQGGWSASEPMPDNSWRAKWQRYMSGDAPDYIEELSYVTNLKLRVFKNDLMKMGAK